MSTPLTALVALLVAAAAVALWIALTYNGLRALQYACDDAWSLVDVQLRRRADLVPNLVSVVGAYAEHERAVLEAAAQARGAALAEHVPTAANAAAEGRLGSSIASVIAVSEGYPELKASANFLQLERELADLESQIAASREIYNGNVASYRTRCQQVPSAWVARRFGFPVRELFVLPTLSDRSAPAVPPLR
ncbi:MAG: LemA family protein [Solirubrobacteraceae bacterium]|nr:LemA family protein [Patulibacter sp.]